MPILRQKFVDPYSATFIVHIENAENQLPTITVILITQSATRARVKVGHDHIYSK